MQGRFHTFCVLLTRTVDNINSRLATPKSYWQSSLTLRVRVIVVQTGTWWIVYSVYIIGWQNKYGPGRNPYVLPGIWISKHGSVRLLCWRTHHTVGCGAVRQAKPRRTAPHHMKIPYRYKPSKLRTRHLWVQPIERLVPNFASCVIPPARLLLHLLIQNTRRRLRYWGRETVSAVFEDSTHHGRMEYVWYLAWTYAHHIMLHWLRARCTKSQLDVQAQCRIIFGSPISIYVS